MFSLVLLARNITREVVLYNTLAASAFLLICFDPDWIWDIGFQISYAALFSLCLFSKPIWDILHIENIMLALVWNAASISIAAQILTTPIGIFYFHLFPSYFLNANLLAVPLSSAILLGGILLCILHWIKPLGHLFGWLLEFMIRFLNGFIHHIAQLPGAVIPELTCSVPQLVWVNFISFCFYRYLKLKEKTWLLKGLGAICLFRCIHLIQ